MVILDPLPFSYGSVNNLRARAVLVQSDGLYNNLSPVLHGDIELSINTIQYNLFRLYW